MSTANWTDVLDDGSAPGKEQRFIAAGLTPTDIAEALAVPDRTAAWLEDPHLADVPEWTQNPIARALVAGELGDRAARQQLLFARLRNRSIGDAVDTSTVAEVARQLGVSRQVASRAYNRTRDHRDAPAISSAIASLINNGRKKSE